MTSPTPPLKLFRDEAQVETIKCLSCGGPIALHSFGARQRVVCPHCGSTLAPEDSGALTLLEAASRKHQPSVLPLHARGKLADIEWVLSDQFKEFNLDCVSCHVTGYEKPGGSTVTHVELLKNVQCEVCHGPGSKHERSPKVAMPVPRPQADTCTACHHPPHVHEFDGASKMNLILGKGHGRK